MAKFLPKCQQAIKLKLHVKLQVKLHVIFQKSTNLLLSLLSDQMELGRGGGGVVQQAPW